MAAVQLQFIGDHLSFLGQLEERNHDEERGQLASMFKMRSSGETQGQGVITSSNNPFAVPPRHFWPPTHHLNIKDKASENGVGSDEAEESRKPEPPLQAVTRVEIPPQAFQTSKPKDQLKCHPATTSSHAQPGVIPPPIPARSRPPGPRPRPPPPPPPHRSRPPAVHAQPPPPLPSLSPLPAFHQPPVPLASASSSLSDTQDCPSTRETKLPVKGASERCAGVQVVGTPPPPYSELYPPASPLRRYSHGQVPSDQDCHTKHHLPPPRPNPPNRKLSEGSIPTSSPNNETIAAKFRRNKSVRLPPPIQTNLAYQDDAEDKTSPGVVSLRQDSTVSSDSFSQTSSPSYTVKSMEAPLLGKRTTSCGRKKFLGAKELGPIRVENEDGVSCDPNTSPITKSHSTPASLQTIVRFHNGSNMSLHHKIMRDIRRPSSHSFITRKGIKFQLVQILINAIAIIAIAGGLAAYFRAYPTTVRYVNRTVTTTKVLHLPQDINLNPAPGLCLPVIVPFCLQHKVPYNYTMFPNYMGHFNQREASQEIDVYEAVVDVRCYELSALFLCSVFVPKCGPEGQLVRPCRSLCYETKRRCGFFLEVFGLPLPEYLDCELFPESDNNDVCLGHKEVKQAQLRAQRPVCTSGFQCDVKRCIPSDWQCDGHVDCEDQSDELNCTSCAKDMIHCGENQCIDKHQMCNGEVNCPWGQDERNCMRLSGQMGDEAHGRLEIYQPSSHTWRPACVRNWDATTTPKTICNVLGYSEANSSSLTMKGNNVPLTGTSTQSMWRFYKKKKTNLVKELRTCPTESYPTVDLVCSNVVCGERRTHPPLGASMRIIGGTESTPGDWPFLAALLGGPEQVFYCAGVLISDQWVLTASHCVGNFSGDTSGWTIQLGITRRHAHSYFDQKAKVKRVVAHPLYNIGVAHDNDVALFQLTKKVTFHEHLLPVCLPSPTYELQPGTMCTVIGWGKREDNDVSEYEAAVNEVQVPVLNRTVCNKWLEPRDLNVTQGMICAGYEAGGKDACQGDSGGPLLCRSRDNPDRWFVGGIVSWGIKCAHPKLPGVYAYVPHYVKWIKQQMALYSNRD